MQSERIYLVWAHPRHDSLTAHIADAIHQRAMERKIQVTELDLNRRNFNPVIRLPHEQPDKYAYGCNSSLNLCPAKVGWAVSRY